MLHQVCTKAWPPFQWGSDLMANVPQAVEQAVKVAKTAQILAYVKENQLLTALCLFVLWQAGAFISMMNSAQGAIC